MRRSSQGAAVLRQKLADGALDEKLRLLGGGQKQAVAGMRERYIRRVGAFAGEFGSGGDIRLLSVPGRSEVGGNHTDHNHGRVLACAVNLDIIAAARKNDDGVVRIHSEGYAPDVVPLDDLSPHAEEHYQSRALVRGVCARLRELGYRVGGFDASTASAVLKGSGLSSSAAFEVMVAALISHLYNDGRIDPVVMAQAGQYAEGEFFGKPCGLMDQTACAVGGFITIDFADNDHPVIQKLDFDFSAVGHSLCIVDTAGDHANLNEEYAAIRREMETVARLLGHRYLRECDEGEFYARLPQIRQEAGDRAALRAIHFFGDNARVTEETRALATGDFRRFKELVIESGRSSALYLQNGYSIREPHRQGLMLALALAEKLLAGRGAWRLHGGGFAGTIQAFVPDDMVPEFVRVMNHAFGPDACHVLAVRPVGACCLA